MAKVTIAEQDIAEVDIPPTGQATIFLDSIDKKVKVRLDDGSTKEVVYNSAGPPVDKNYTQSFSGVSTVLVIHNLGKIPTIVIYDSSTGKEIKGEITYDLGDINNRLTVTFNTVLSGNIVCN